MTTTLRHGLRGYNDIDVADGSRRKIFRHPDELTNHVFALYGFRLGKRVRATAQVNVSNVLDEQKVVALPRNTSGTIRHFAYQYSPRKLSFTTSLSS